MDGNVDFLRWTLIFSCVGSGMMAGLFVSFSTFMMKALSSLERSEGVRAMQAINRLIVRPSFLLVFMGTALLSVISAYVSYGDVEPWRYIALSAGLYVVGCLLSTILFNVPLNDQLESVYSHADEELAFWDIYLVRWTRWNHVRSVATVLSTALLAYALLQT
tara:strand:+ start:698 stop:1183 length:486 start_codon:yes stop_codon:yes gene_type:complete